MPEPARASTRQSTRPRAKGFLRLDLQNAYAQIQVSPLVADEEISAAIAKRRGEANRRARARGDRGEDLDEILQLDRIFELIGDPKKRKAYDEANPQNSLLTVQPSLTEQAFAKHRRAAQISEWLRTELGATEILPSPSCQKLWAPSGLARELEAFLKAFVSQTEAVPSKSPETPAVADRATAPLSLEVLETILNQEPK